MHIDYTNKSEPKKEKKIYTNYEIFRGKIRLIEDGVPPKILERDEAIEMAKSRDMDLVQIAYNKSDFPHSICKIYNYSKFRYEQKKKEKLAKKQAKANEIDIKEVCFSIRIDTGDFSTKCRMIRDFLADGDKVKILVKLLRRESNLAEYAKNMMKRVLGEIEDVAELDTAPSASGSILSCVVRRKR